MNRLLPLVMFLGCLLFAAHSAETPPAAWPLWNGQESTADYAKRVGLEPTKTLDLGNGVKLEMVLIPAGKFMMGTPEPKPVDEEGFYKKIVIGQAFFAAGVGALLLMISVVVIRAIRLRRRPQYSLARFIAMILVLSVAVLGGEHWWYSSKALEEARVEYQAVLADHSDQNEKPTHKVTLTKPFYMGKFTVTQEQYQQVIGINPSRFKGKDNPVEKVSWNDAQEFCKKLGQTTNQTLRLPTEAEWEYACRAGTSTRYYSGNNEEALDRVAWHGTVSYEARKNNTTHPVGQKEPNSFGLFDMHGNVMQWCQDWFGDYTANEVADPQGPAQGAERFWYNRVLRGGDYFSCPWRCRSAYRAVGEPTGCYWGFRVVVPASNTP